MVCVGESVLYIFVKFFKQRSGCVKNSKAYPFFLVHFLFCNNYLYYLCKRVFHGIRFKVRGLVVARQLIFFILPPIQVLFLPHIEQNTTRKNRPPHLESTPADFVYAVLYTLPVRPVACQIFSDSFSPVGIIVVLRIKNIRKEK